MVESIIFALDRGVQVKALMSFEYDNIPISDLQELEINKLIHEIRENFRDLGLSSDRDGYDLRFTFKRFPNCYNIIDNERVIMKL